MNYLFENYCLDTDRRELRFGANLIAIEPQVFDVLLHLIRHCDRVVSNDDLITAVWHDRIVSDSTLTTRINAVRRAVGDSGQQQRLIRTIARKGHRFVGEVREEPDPRGKVAFAEPSLSTQQQLDSPSQGQHPPPVPEKPSIAVLPFANLSGDSEQEYFADGISEDIITALSRFHWLLVIARNSSFTYRGRASDVKRIGHELGVRYLLDGSVRRAANRVRITSQLVDVRNGAHLWADRFDGALEDIFDLQDRISTSVVGAIAPKLEQAEIDRSKLKPTENLDAYDCFLRGMASVHRWTRDSNAEALRFFYKAIDLDPNFAAAYGLAARCYSQRKFSGWMDDQLIEGRETERLARQAAELGRDISIALCTAGLALAYVVGEVDDGIALTDRALGLNPSLAWAWLFSGWVNVVAGEPNVAIDRVTKAMRLSPQDPHIFNMQGVIASAYFFADRDNEAAIWAEKAFRDRPNYLFGYLIRAAAKAITGQIEDAKQTMSHLRQLDPNLRISNLNNLVRLRRPEDFAKLMSGVRKAGLPE